MFIKEPKKLKVIREEFKDTDCVLCPLAIEGKAERPVLGEGPEDPDFIIIGEGPGQNESRLGRPFVGKSGLYVNNFLKTTGSEREKVFCTNATLCKPFTNTTDDQKLRAMRHCSKRLKNTLNKFPDKPILAVGAVAAQFFIKKVGKDKKTKFSITEMAGTLNEVDIKGVGKRFVIPTFHPAYFLHSDGKQDLVYYNILYDFGKMVRFAKGEMEKFSVDIKIELESPHKVSRMIDEFIDHVYQDAKWFACDTETHGQKREIFNINGEKVVHKHDAREARYAIINAIGLATDKYGISVPWNLVTVRTKEKLRKLFEDADIEKVFHNQLYDIPVLYWNKGYNVNGKVRDTMILHHDAFPGMPHGLQRVTSQFYLIDPWKSEYRSEGDSLEDHLTYCAKDTLSTARLKAPLVKSVKSKAEKVAAVDARMAEIAFEMHVNGLYVSREVNQEMKGRLLPIVEEKRRTLVEKFQDKAFKEEYIHRLAMEMAKKPRKDDPPEYDKRIDIRIGELTEKIENGTQKFSPNFFMHVSSYLLAGGVPLTKLTDKGGISTDKETLESFGHRQEVRDILEFRSMDKYYATFVRSLPLFMDEHGYVHPNWKVNKNTGRWSADKPTVMNVPSGDDELPNLRKQFTAPEGYVYVGADMDKFEARIIAQYSQEPFLLKTFKEGTDLHSGVAAMILPGFDKLEKKDPKFKKGRDLAKSVEYGFFYKATDETLWSTIVKEKDYSHIKLVDVQEFSKRLRQQMPRVEQFHNALFKQVATKKELVVPIDGRRWMFPLGLTDPNLVSNWSIQSSAASIMNSGLDTLHKRLKEIPQADAKIRLQQHDAAYVTCKEDYADQVAKIVEESLSQEYTINGVTMDYPAEAKIGTSWGDC